MAISMDKIIAQMEAERAAAAEDADEARGKLALKLFHAGVRHVMVSFSGCGDSGQIDEISIAMAEGKPEQDWMRLDVEAWSDRYLEGTGVDWYNNDGGFGEIEFTMPMWPGRFRAEVSQYATVSEVAHSQEDVA